MSTPSYIEVRKERRRKTMTKFLDEMVVPADEFGLDDVDVIEGCCTASDNATQAFCDWFSLGDWFYNEMRAINFDVFEYLIDLRCRVETTEREVADFCREIKHDRRSLEEGGCFMT